MSSKGLLIIAVIHFFFAMYIEYGADHLWEKYVKKIYDFLGQPQWLVLIGAIVYILIEKRFNDYEEKLDAKEIQRESETNDLKQQMASLMDNHREEIKQYEEKLKDKALAIISNYEELKNFKQLEKQKELMRNYISKNSYIMAIQLYEYSEDEFENHSITVNYVAGKVSSSVDLNAILQEH